MVAELPCDFRRRRLLPGALLIAFLVSGCEPTPPPSTGSSSTPTTTSKRAEMRKYLQNPQTKEAPKPAAP